MIDNIILLISGVLHDRDMDDLIEKCHPLGMFEFKDGIPSLTTTKVSAMALH